MRFLFLNYNISTYCNVLKYCPTFVQSNLQLFCPNFLFFYSLFFKCCNPKSYLYFVLYLKENYLCYLLFYIKGKYFSLQICTASNLLLGPAAKAPQDQIEMVRRERENHSVSSIENKQSQREKRSVIIFTSTPSHILSVIKKSSRVFSVLFDSFQNFLYKRRGNKTYSIANFVFVVNAKIRDFMYKFFQNYS